MVLWIIVIYDTRIFCYVIHLILLWANEPIQRLACHIEASVFSQPRSYINMSNRTSIKYPGTTTTTSNIHLNNIYIGYSFLRGGVVLQIRQVLGVILLLVAFSLVVKALSIRLRRSLVLLHRRGSFL